MGLYHYNSKTGAPGRCSAKKGQCPFGSSAEHFSSEAAVYEAIEKNFAGDALSSKGRAKEDKQWIDALNRGEAVTIELPTIDDMELSASLNPDGDEDVLKYNLAGSIIAKIGSKKFGVMAHPRNAKYLTTDNKIVKITGGTISTIGRNGDFNWGEVELTSEQASALVSAHELAMNFYSGEGVSDRQNPGAELVAHTRHIEATLKSKSFKVA